MLAFYLAVGAGLAAASPRVGQAPATSPDPDALYAARADLAKAKEAEDIWQRRTADAKDYDAFWKLARACYFLATQGPKTEQDSQLDRGIVAGRQAAALQPNQPDGHFWYAANMGEKAQRGGMIAGLKYKGEIKSELERVIQIHPGWQAGSGESALGQWYVKVPDNLMCCGGDHKKGIALLRQALSYNPESSQARYTLAEALADDTKTRAEAKSLLEQVIAAPIDPDWIVEDQGFKVKAHALLDKLNAKKS